MGPDANGDRMSVEKKKAYAIAHFLMALLFIQWVMIGLWLDGITGGHWWWSFAPTGAMVIFIIGIVAGAAGYTWVHLENETLRGEDE